MDNKSKFKFFLPLIGIFVFAMLLGFSFAYYKKTSKQANGNVFTTLTCLETTITDTTSALSLSEVYPITDDEGMNSSPYTFTLTNNCTTATKVEIGLESLITSTLPVSAVKVSFNNSGETYNRGKLLNSHMTGTPASGGTAFILKTIYLDAGEAQSFDLRMWVDVNVTKEEGFNKIFDSKIIVMSTALGNTPTLNNMILMDNPVSLPVTTPGREASTSSEKELSSSPDNYGTSYYYRGNVENNYVLFANMCWRAVRITGDGAVKLVLANYNPNSYENPCDISNDEASASFARFDGDNYNSKFNNYYNDNAYIGYMFGYCYSDTYADTHQNKYSSPLLSNLNSWYDNVLAVKPSFDETKLADTIWCNDKGSFGGIKAGVTYSYSGYYNNKTIYGPSTRTSGTDWSSGGAGVSFTCPLDSNNGTLSKFTVSDDINGNAMLQKKIGLLTIDEVGFAGGSYGISNSNYYLNKNASAAAWWSMSPSDFDGTAHALSISANGSYERDSVTSSYAIRPSIALNANTILNSGSGLSYDPYNVD